MSDIKSSVDLTVEAKSIYEAWNWDMLEEQMESEYDRGAFRELVNMYVNLVDNISSLITTIESQKEEIENGIAVHIEYMHTNKRLANEIESLKAITELKNAEIENLKDHLGDIHYGLTCLDPVLEMPEKGYVRNQYNKLLDVCKEFRHE